MSVAILQQPAPIAFSRNPMLFRFQSDALRAQAGARSICLLSPIAFTGPFSFTLAYNGLSLAFSGMDDPDQSGYQLHAGVAGMAPADFVARFAAELAGNFYLARDFVIQAASAPFYAVQLTARSDGDSYDITMPASENMSLSQQQQGVNEVFQPNFKLYTELWAENEDHSDFTKVSDAFLEVDQDGTCEIDLSDPLTNVLLADGFDRPNVRFAVATADERSCRKYYLAYAEAYGATQVIRGLVQTDHKTALLGGISKEKLEEFAFPGYFLSGGLLNFLKQDGQAVLVRPEQQEYVSLVTFNQGFGVLRLHFKITFTDGTSMTRDGDSFAAVQQYEKFSWPVGYEQNHFQLLDAARVVQKYEVSVLDEDAKPVTETRTYVLDYNYKPYTRYFLYLSSFGSYDTKLTYGKASNQYDVVTSSAARTLQGQFHLVDGEQVNYAIDLNNTETYTTGYRTMRVIRSFRDLFLSIDKLELRKGRAYPLEFASKTISEYKDGDNLHALSFEMGYRFRETLWTYDDQDDLPAGLYLNLPAGSGNTYLPMPVIPLLPANYYDYRYYLKTETYNQAEINAKIAAVLAVVNMNANASQQQFLSIQQIINQQTTNINSLGNTYYTKFEINDLLLKLAISGGAGSAQIVVPDPDNNTFYTLEVKVVNGELTLNLVPSSATAASGNYALDPATGTKYSLRVRVVNDIPQLEPYL